jgi:hypothetical protein
MIFLFFAVIGFLVGFVFASMALDRYYGEQSIQKMRRFSLELMREFAKATREIERAQNKAVNSKLN